MKFLETLRKYYVNRYNKADALKEQMIQKMISTPKKKAEFDLLKSTYFNESVAELVKNQNEQHRIIEQDGILVRKIFPIYMTPHPHNEFDFRDQFYVPQKHFMGRHFDTFYFNMYVIWMMTFVLMVTLYFDVLRKVVTALGNLTDNMKG